MPNYICMNWYKYASENDDFDKIMSIAAISEKTKKKMDGWGYDLIDERYCNGYELSLFKHRHDRVYQIGLQRFDTDCGDLRQQMDVTKPIIDQSCIKKNLDCVKTILREWLNTYGSLTAGSIGSTEKVDFYEKMVRYLGFKLIRHNSHEVEILPN